MEGNCVHTVQAHIQHTYDVSQDADMWSDALRIVKEYLPHKVTYQLSCSRDLHWKC